MAELKDFGVNPVQVLYNEWELMYVQCATWEVVWREFNYHNECTTIELWLDTVE